MAGALRYLSFRAAGRIQTVPADAVREVVKLPRTTRVPHAPAGVIGLANVRGAALPILSVAVLQGKPAASGDRVLVLDRAPPIGLLVDEVRTLADARGRARALDVDALIGAAMRPAHARTVAPVAHAPVVTPADAPRDAEAKLSLLSFIAGGQEFALPLDEAVEVLSMPRSVTRLPDADAAVIGTIEHRGGLLPILALAQLLGLADSSVAPTRIVVARIKGHRAGLAVEAMRSVLSVSEASVDAVPSMIARRGGEARIQAIARIEDGRRLVSILAADELLHERLIAGLAERHDTKAGDGDDMANAADAAEPFLVFRLGEQSFGLPAPAVDEVVRVPDTLTCLPRAPDFVEGVMNLRGRAIPVIDQRRRFGGTGSADQRRRAVVVRLGTLQAAFVVDEVTRIHRINAASIAPAPDLSAETRLFDRTAVMPDGSIVLLIEPAELLDGTERELLGALRTDPAGAPA